MAALNRPFRASYALSGLERERVFAALLDVPRFTEWSHGLERVRMLNSAEVRPGCALEFVLSAGGLTHRVVGTVTAVEPPRRLEWHYTEGATGSGGWLVEESGPGAVRLTLLTNYEIRPAWLNAIAHRPFFRRATEELLRRSIRSFERHLKSQP